MQNKQRVTEELIEHVEAEHAREMMAFLRGHPSVVVLGSLDADKRIPIFAFNIKDRDGYLLHSSLVTRMLSDFFGIDSRAGCSCSGPQGLDLFGLDQNTFDEVLRPWISGTTPISLVKPGWCRLNLHYTLDAHARQYIQDAISFLAEHGHKLQLLYQVNVLTATWTPRAARPDSDVELLGAHRPVHKMQFDIAEAASFACDSFEISSSHRHHALLRAQLDVAADIVKLVDQQLAAVGIDPAAELPPSLYVPLPEIADVFSRLVKKHRPCPRRCAGYRQELTNTLGRGVRVPAATNLPYLRAKARELKGDSPGTTRAKQQLGHVLAF